MTLTYKIASTCIATGLALAAPAEAKTRIVVLANDFSKASAEQVGATLGGVFSRQQAGDRLIAIRAGSGGAGDTSAGFSATTVVAAPPSGSSVSW